MISVHFQGKPFNITVIQVYAPTSNAEEAEVEWFYAITILLLIIVLFYHTNNGDFKRWIPIGGFTLQPSDIAKFTVILTLAYYCSKNYNKMSRPLHGIVYPLLIIAAFCGLIYKEHHLSCTILVFCIGASIMFTAGTDLRLFIVGLGIIIAVVAVVILYPDVLMNYAGNRVEAWLNKDFEPRGLRWPLYLLLRAGMPQKKCISHHGQQKSPKCSTWMQSQK